MPTLVILESPCRANALFTMEEHLEYARECLKHSIGLGEIPFVSHLLYTQVLDDTKDADRVLGLYMAREWINRVDSMVVYTDFGISEGMAAAITLAKQAQISVYYRTVRG